MTASQSCVCEFPVLIHCPPFFPVHVCVCSCVPHPPPVQLRGSSSHLLDEAERSLHDALCVLTETMKESRVVYGGGAMEVRAGTHTHTCTHTQPLSESVPSPLALSMFVCASVPVCLCVFVCLCLCAFTG